MKKREHWSKRVEFVIPVFLFAMFIVLGLMFFTCKFAVYLYDEAIILIETIGRL